MSTTSRSHRFSPWFAPLPGADRTLRFTTKAVALVALVAFGGTGCLSDRYRIPDDELARQAELPPSARGQRLRVVQSIGERAAPPLNYGAPPATAYGAPANAYGGPVDAYGAPVHAYGAPPPQSNVHVGVMLGANLGPGPRYAAPPPPPQTVVASPPRAGAPAGAPAGGSPSPAPAGPSSGFRSGSGGSKSSGNSTSDAKALAALVVLAAAGAAIGAVATEGARFDGAVVVAPNHPVYLTEASGAVRVQPLDSLTPADLAGVSRAEISDAEAAGLLRLERAPLNRRGFSFKLEGGSVTTRVQDQHVSGAGANIQLGYFLTRNLGLMLTSTLTGGQAPQAGGYFRSQIGGELQAFLPPLGPVHLGGYGGVAALNTEIDDAGRQGATALGAGGLLEIELTTRLALSLRVGGTWSQPSGGSFEAEGLDLLAGVAIY